MNLIQIHIWKASTLKSAIIKKLLLFFYQPFTDSERTLPEQVEPVDEASDSEHNVVSVRKNSVSCLKVKSQVVSK